MRWAWCAVTLMVLAGEANAQPAPSLLPRVALDYRVAPDLDCPSAEEVQAEIVRELKGNPFTAPGPVVGLFHVIASTKAPDALEIPVTFDDVAGMRSFKTSFEGSRRSTTCRHLVRTHVVGEITNQITTLMGRRVRALLAARAAAPECSSGSGPTPACNATRFDLWPQDWPLRLPKPKPDPPPPPERLPLAVRVGVTVGPEAVASGFPSVGVSAEVGVRYRAFSAGMEVHGDPPLGSIVYPNVGAVSFARLSGALLLCWHLGLFVGCGLGDVGAFVFPNHIPALPASDFYGAIGLQAGLDVPVDPPRLFIHTAVDMRAPIHPAQHTWHGATIFEAAGPGVGLGAGLRLELPP